MQTDQVVEQNLQSLKFMYDRLDEHINILRITEDKLSSLLTPQDKREEPPVSSSSGISMDMIKEQVDTIGRLASNLQNSTNRLIGT